MTRYDKARKGAFSPHVRETIGRRDARMCAIGIAASCRPHGDWLGLQIHHRMPRQAGGSAVAMVGMPSNGLVVCDPCHRWAESNRAAAERMGWIVRRGIRTPAEVPVQHARLGWVLLDDDGGSTPTEEGGN